MRVMALAVALLLTWPPGSVAQGVPFPEIAGWKKTAEIQTFLPKTLYEHINGAADLYLTSDFEELKVAEYEDQNKGSVIVEVYRHRTAEDAFGIYSQERPSEGNFLAIGAEGYVDQHLLNFVTGRYYIKINSFNTGAEDRDILQRFAGKLADGSGVKGALPAILSAFPAEGKKGRSEKYITRNFLGYPFLHSAFTADYESEGRTFRLFVIDAARAEESGNIVRHYLRQVNSTEKGANEGRHTLTDPHHGVVELYRKGRYIGGIVDLPDAGLRSRFMKRLQEAIEKRS